MTCSYVHAYWKCSLIQSVFMESGQSLQFLQDDGGIERYC